MTARLGDVARFINGAAFKPTDWETEGSPIIRIQNLTDSSKPFNRTTRAVPDQLIVRTGDILVSWSATLGVFTWDHDEDGLLNQHIFRVLPDESVVDKNYLFHALREAVAKMSSHLHGATMQHVNRGAFLGFEIPLPPLPEQRRIAAILDEADLLIDNQANVLSSIEDLTEALFRSFFDVPTTVDELGQLPRLESYAEQITDGEHQTPLRTEDGYKLLSARNVRNGMLDMTDVDFVGEAEFERIARRCRPTRGDVLISCSGSVGRVTMVATDEPFVLVRSVAMIRPTTALTGTYLEWWLRSAPIQREIAKVSRSSAQANLFQAPIRNLPILVPPLERQREFESHLGLVKNYQNMHQSKRLLMTELKSALARGAFVASIRKNVAG
ncbi:hypothetical protein ASF06_04105 [Agreia sp. Leaf244]|uniref:restriction endonuclease subunit S n=1 Tax=Agreia sp. Leaf244 TaxID=1736305 RepID=UPI0006F1F548|nr:restriction endonuclease subunit S [Agreia sp. Leaf244]KQO11810.1 hypothetical protein ASF06_04105 [Agreia sp. Leaf244]